MPMIAELERSCVAMHQAQPKYSHLQPLAPPGHCVQGPVSNVHGDLDQVRPACSAASRSLDAPLVRPVANITLPNRPRSAHHSGVL